MSFDPIFKREMGAVIESMESANKLKANTYQQLAEKEASYEL